MRRKRIVTLLLALLLTLGLTACFQAVDGQNTAYREPEESGLHLIEDEPEGAGLTLIEEPADKTPELDTTPAEDPTEAKEEPAGQPVTAEPDEPADPQPPAAEPEETPTLDEHGTYSSKEDVALYIHLYGRLPENFITKKEAEKLGWTGGSLEPYAPGKCIGGSYFGNYEGLLPEKDGRRYTECDIDTLGARSRGAKRIVFSNDGLIYYTEDHYETFELLYGEADG